MSEMGLTVMGGGNGGAIGFRQATEAAGICKAIVTATAMKIGGRSYVRVEGWQAIAVAHGCIASARDVERIEGGVRAIGEVRRGSDGHVLSSAEGYVGDDEATWGKRDEYAKRAMAQTRAISRACRSAFAHVVVMMNAGLETVPAEEVTDGEAFEHRTAPPPPTRKAQPPAHPAQAPAAATPREPVATDAADPFAPDSGNEMVEGLIEAMSTKPAPRGGNRYGIKIGEAWFNTFSDTVAQIAKAMKGQGAPVRLAYRTNAKGYHDIVDHGIEAIGNAAQQEDAPDAGPTAEELKDMF